MKGGLFKFFKALPTPDKSREASSSVVEPPRVTPEAKHTATRTASPTKRKTGSDATPAPLRDEHAGAKSGAPQTKKAKTSPEAPVASPFAAFAASSGAASSTNAKCPVPPVPKRPVEQDTSGQAQSPNAKRKRASASKSKTGKTGKKVRQRLKPKPKRAAQLSDDSDSDAEVDEDSGSAYSESDDAGASSSSEEASLASEEDSSDDDWGKTAARKRKSKQSNGTKGSQAQTRKPNSQAVSSGRATGTGRTGFLSRSPAPRPGLSSQSSNAASQPSKSMTAGAGVKLAGDHMHDMQKFLEPEHRRDGQGRRAGEAGYDPRTLQVPARFLAEQSPAQQQWWTVKMHNMDTVLFFKVGKFYELFHMDADIGASHLDLIYMKGDHAHSGFPELGYAKNAEKLAKLGYKVARVEQTETPDMVKARKAREGARPNNKSGKGVTGGSWKDKTAGVSRREIVSMLSPGSRTYCFMDLDGTMAGNDATKGRPLAQRATPPDAPMEGRWMLALLERPLQCAEKSSEIAAAAAAESESKARVGHCYSSHGDERLTRQFGVCLVDAATGAFRFSQFADGPQSQRLRTMLALFAVSELVLSHGEFAISDDVARILRHDLPIPWQHRNELPAAKPGSTGPFDAAQLKGTALGFWAPADGTRAPLPAQFPDAAGAARMFGTPRGAYFRDAEGKALPCTKWPALLRALMCADGSSGSGDTTDPALAPFLTKGVAQWDLGLSALGGMLQQLARCLVDQELFSMANFALYVPRDCIIEEQHPPTSQTSNTAPGLLPGPETEADSLAPDTPIMVLDNSALANLEVLQNQHDGGKKGTLLAYLDHCRTAFGKRLLRQWLSAPLLSIGAIKHRTDAVAALKGLDSDIVDMARNRLKQLLDLPRLLSRVHSVGDHYRANEHPEARAVMYESPRYNKRKIKALAGVLDGFESAERIVEVLQPHLQSDLGRASHLLRRLFVVADGEAGYPDLSSELSFFKKAFKRKQALESGSITPTEGYAPDYDEAQAAVADATHALDSYRREQQRELGARDIKYWGKDKDRFQLELPTDLIKRLGGEPPEYELKSKTKKVHRFWTPKIRELFSELQEAEVREKRALDDQMRAIFHRFDQSYAKWSAAADALAVFDCLASLSLVSSGEGFVRAEFHEVGDAAGVTPFFEAVDGRHPSVEATLGPGEFIPNGTALGARPQSLRTGDDAIGIADRRLLLLSGPNMGGKSTLLRQNCVLAIMAQIGCFVPATNLRLTPVDRIFTRLGASDRILAGQSTFFVELAETATILHEATEHSLVILDELGRGTSTFDGTAIADAVVHHIASNVGCRTMFATHYHSLIEDYADHRMVQLGHMACIADTAGAEKSDGAGRDVTFLYQLQPGACSKSYGVNVARLAQLPAEVVDLASSKSDEFAQLQTRQTQQAQKNNKARELASRIASACDGDVSLADLVSLQSECCKVISDLRSHQ